MWYGLYGEVCVCMRVWYVWVVCVCVVGVFVWVFVYVGECVSRMRVCLGCVCVVVFL